ncbi:hypothetical protein ACJX0J_008356, partial [Zea mays]
HVIKATRLLLLLVITARKIDDIPMYRQKKKTVVLELKKRSVEKSQMISPGKKSAIYLHFFIT